MEKLSAAIITVTPFQQNCVLLWDEATKAGVVVDPGGEVNRILSAISEIGMKTGAIWLTHGHIDHAGGAEDLKRALGVEIVGPHRADEELLSSIERQSEMFGVPGDFKNARPDKWLEEGETVMVGPHEFEVLHCPGHAPGHVVFINRENKFAHVGDVLFRGSIGRTDLPGGNHDQLISSIKTKLIPLGDEFRFICGHGPGSDIGTERTSNPFLI